MKCACCSAAASPELGLGPAGVLLTACATDESTANTYKTPAHLTRGVCVTVRPQNMWCAVCVVQLLRVPAERDHSWHLQQGISWDQPSPQGEPGFAMAAICLGIELNLKLHAHLSQALSSKVLPTVLCFYGDCYAATAARGRCCCCYCCCRCSNSIMLPTGQPGTGSVRGRQRHFWVSPQWCGAGRRFCAIRTRLPVTHTPC